MALAPWTLLAAGALLLVAHLVARVPYALIGAERTLPRLSFWPLFALAALGVLAAWPLASAGKLAVAAALERALVEGRGEARDLVRTRGRFASMMAVLLLRALAGAALFFGAQFVLVPWIWVVGFFAEPDQFEALLYAGAAAYLLFATYVWLGMGLMTNAVAVEGFGPIDAFLRSWSLARGNRLRLLGYRGVLALVARAGILACAVGVLPTFALAAAADVESYVRLVRGDEQEGWALPASVRPEGEERYTAGEPPPAG